MLLGLRSAGFITHKESALYHIEHTDSTPSTTLTSLFSGMDDFVDNEFDANRYKRCRRRLLVGCFDNAHQKYLTVDSKCNSPLIMKKTIVASASILHRLGCSAPHGVYNF